MLSPRKKWISIAAMIIGSIFIYFLFIHYPPFSKSSIDFRKPAQSIVQNPTRVDVVFAVDVSVAHRGDLIKRLQLSGVIHAKREVEIVACVAEKSPPLRFVKECT